MDVLKSKLRRPLQNLIKMERLTGRAKLQMSLLWYVSIILYHHLTLSRKVNELQQKQKLHKANPQHENNTTVVNIIERELQLLRNKLFVMHRSRQFNINPERKTPTQQ